MPLESWFRPKSSTMLGIDIQSRTVTVLGVSFHADQIVIQGYDTVSLPNDPPNNLPKSEDISFCIQKAIANAQLQGKLATVAMSDSEVVSKIFSFSQTLTQPEMLAFIKMEVAVNSPFPQEFINWDFKILGPSQVDPDLQDIQVVVCRREAIQTRMAIIQKAGLEIHAVDLESCALERYQQWRLKTSTNYEKITMRPSITKDEGVSVSVNHLSYVNYGIGSLDLACGLALRRLS